MNAKQMQGMMRKMGINQVEIDAARVIIEKEDGGRIIIDEPNVSKIKMQGQETFQIAGESYEETAEVEVSEDDVKMIIEKTGATEEKAREVLEETGDLTEAILELS